MNILELCLSDGVGGLELYVVRTVKQIKARHLNCFAVVKKDSMTADRLSEQGVETQYLTSRSRIFPFVAACRLARFIKNNNIDVVHMHWAKDLSLAVLATMICNLVCNKHVRLIYTRQMMLTRSKQDFYHRFLYRRVSLFITITHQLKVLADGYLPMPSEAIKVLYYGVADPEVLEDEEKNALKKEFKSHKANLTVGIIGRIEQGKGQHLVIKAIKKLIKNGASVQVTVVGPIMDKVYFEELKNQTKNDGLTEYVYFYGSHTNPIDIMSAFDVVVLASDNETFGLVLIEAMRNGVAVIGTDAGGVPEIINHGETGLLFRPKDSDDLTEQLWRLYKDSDLRKKIALAGKQYADEHFNQERHYDALVSWIEGVVQGV